MRLPQLLLFCAVLCAASPTLPAAESEVAKLELREAIAAARDKVYPALVNIGVVWETENGGREVRFRATGSGTILDDTGLVLTNHHVAGKATRIVCTLSDKEEVPAELVGTDALTDLSVLRLKLSERKDPKAPLPTAALGDSDALAVGDYVLAMGSPQGMARSVTLGIVSNKERPAQLGDLDGEPTGTLTLWIQHDALINPGNSGGPLVNLKGEVIGVNEAGNGQGFGFAIPSNLAKDVVAEILKHSRVPRAWLGVRAQTLLKKGGVEEGVLVGSVEPGSPAVTAGIQPGDILLSFDGTSVTTRFEDEVPLFYRRVAETRQGKEVEIVLSRKGEKQTVKATLGVDEPVRDKDKEIRRLGLTAEPVTRAIARDLHLSGTEGVFLSGIQAGGAAGTAKPALQGGDILRVIGGKPTASIKDLTDFLDTIKPEEKRTVLAEVERRGARVLSALLIEPKTEESQGAQVAKAWLGCDTQVLTRSLSEALGLSGTKGVRVTEVYPDCPADKAGLKAGDIVTQIGDQPVNAFHEGHAEVFDEMIRRRRIGEKTILKLLRDGKPQDLEVTLGASPTEPKDAKHTKDEDFEFSAREITFQDRRFYRWEKDLAGVVVDTVEPSGWAGFAGLSAGQMILKIGDQDIRSLDDLKAALADLKKRKPAQVAFMVRYGIHTGFLSVEPQWE